MRVALVEPFCETTPWEYSISSRENLGLGYLAAVLRGAGHEVSVHSGPEEKLSPERLAVRVGEDRPEVIGISLPFTDELQGSSSSLRALDEAFGEEAFLIAGGHAATAEPQRVFELVPRLRCVVRGEGEQTLPELLEAVQTKGDLTCVDGLYLPGGNQGPMFTGQRSLVRDLDDLPFPARDQLVRRVHRREALGEVYVTGSRGCPYRCSFCDIKTFYEKGTGPAWRGRSPDNVVGELEKLVARFGTEVVYVFVDDQFIGPGPAGRRRCLAFAETLRKADLGIQFEVTCRADSIRRESLEALKEAGLAGVYLGLDSGSDSVLRRYQKDLDVEVNLRAARLVRDVGIPLDFGFIMFDPWTTPRELDQSLAFLGWMAAEGFPLHKAHFMNTLKLYPNTPIATRRGVEGEESPETKIDWSILQARRTLARALEGREGGLAEPVEAERVIESLRETLLTA